MSLRKKSLFSTLIAAIAWPVCASLGYEHRERLIQPGPEAPVLDIAFANGHFHLRDTNGVFRSANGLDWEWARPGTVFGNTKVGDLWFRVVDEEGPFDGIYASPDGANWRKTDALRIPQQFGDGLYVSMFSERVADLSLGNLRHFALSPDGFQWSLIETARDGGLIPGSRIHGRMGSLWVTSRGGTGQPPQPVPEFRVSADGLSWSTVAWPGADADPDVAYQYGIFFGEGQLLVLRQSPASGDPSEVMGFRTEDLVSWHTAPVFWPEDVPFAGQLEGRIKREGNSYVIRSSWLEPFVHPTFPRTHFFADLQTSDFLHFGIIQEGSSPGTDISGSVGQTAVSTADGVGLEIVLRDNATALLRREGDNEVVTTPANTPPATSFLHSIARLGDRLYIGGGRSVFFSDDDGATWELSKELPSGGILFEPPGSRMQPRIRGVFSLIASQDTVWFASRRQTVVGGLREIGEIWRKSPTGETWTRVKEFDDTHLQYFSAEGGYLTVTGVRDETAFVAWSTDGETWETHEFPEPLAELQLRHAGGTFWVAGASADKWQGSVLSSGDLRTWETVLTSNNGSFGDVAVVNGNLVVAERNTQTTDHPSRYFVTLPDGSILDNHGSRTVDGVTWINSDVFDFGRYTRLTVLEDVLYQIDFTTRAGPSAQQQVLFNFSFLERYALAFDRAASRPHIFSASEQTSLDGRVLTEWGEFRQLAPGWFEHRRLGIVHAPTNPEGSYWYWIEEDEAWTWLHPDLYPFSYRSTDSNWVYLGGEVPGWRYSYTENLWRHEPLRSGRTFDLPPGPAHPLLHVPAGTFLMGTQFADWQAHPDEFPAHLVEIEEGFWFAALETTQAEFARVMGYNPAPPEHRSARFPALNVTLAEAMEYCERLTDEGHAAGWLPETHAVRLPTEAQWEYAARAGVWAETLTVYAQPQLLWRFLPNYGHFSGFDAARGNVVDAPEPAWGPLPVGSLPPARTDFSAHDTHGNVWEWCRNPYYLYDPEGDYPEGSLQAVDLGYTTARGGGWRSDDRDVRLTNRAALAPGFRSDDVGFRIIIERAD